MAEIQLSVLSRQVLSQRIGSFEKLQQILHRWEEQHNADGHTICWRFTAEDARIKLRRLYPTLEVRSSTSRMTGLEVITEKRNTSESLPTSRVVEVTHLAIKGINERWYDEAVDCFKVAASDGRLYRIRRSFQKDEWTVIEVWQLDA